MRPRHLHQIRDATGLFRLSVQRLYEKVCDRLAPRGVEILTPVNRAKEFLLGDVPAVTYNTTSGNVGFAGGVAIDQADEVFMPLAPVLKGRRVVDFTYTPATAICT